MMYRYRWISDERQENWVAMVDEAGRFDRWWKLGLGTLRHVETRRGGGDSGGKHSIKCHFSKQRNNCTKVSFILC
jgi:hypothetical protein